MSQLHYFHYLCNITTPDTDNHLLHNYLKKLPHSIWMALPNRAHESKEHLVIRPEERKMLQN